MTSEAPRREPPSARAQGQEQRPVASTQADSERDPESPAEVEPGREPEADAGREQVSAGTVEQGGEEPEPDETPEDREAPPQAPGDRKKAAASAVPLSARQGTTPSSSVVERTSFGVSPDQLQSAAATLEGETTLIRFAVEEIAGSIEELSAAWNGVAFSQFGELADRWGSAASATLKSLTGITTLLKGVATAYQRVDEEVGRLFGGGASEKETAGGKEKR